MKRFIIGFLLALTSSVALAQWQVPNGTVPIGRGPGVIGFNSTVASTTGAKCLFDTVPPSFGVCGAAIPSVADFGAKGDGTDQTAVLQTAIASIAEGGELYFPCGNYAISGSGTEVFLRQKPIYLHAAENCVALIVDGVGNSTDIFRFTPNAVSNPYGWRISGFKVFSASGTHARDFINFDTSGTNTGIIVFSQVDHNTVLALNGKAVRFNNALAPVNVSGAANNGSGLVRLTVTSTTGMINGMIATVANVGGTTEANGSWSITVVDGTHIDLTPTFANAYTSGGTVIAANVTGGTTNGMIGPLNSFLNPITFNFGGDSMRIAKNTVAGPGPCIEGQLVIGASGVIIDDANNLSCAGGMVVWDGGASPFIVGNVMEQHGTNTESNNCLVDFRGSTRQVDTATILGNRITTLASTGNPKPLCITNANGAQINNNTLVTPSTYAALTIGASSTNTKVGANNIFIQNGVTVPTNSSTVSDSGTATEYSVPSTLPLGTSGGVPFFNSSGKQATSTLLNANGVMLGGGVGAAPFTTNIGTDGQVFIGRTGLSPVMASVTGGYMTFGTPDGSNNSASTVNKVKGTTTNDNAAAGDVGESFGPSVASGSPVALTTATPANLTSQSLTAGDWDVTCEANFTTAASTSITSLITSISTTSATLNQTPFNIGYWTGAANVPGVANISAPFPRNRISLNSTTTVFCVVQSTFTVSTLGAWGGLYARRPR